jgi:hypothetical protein
LWQWLRYATDEYGCQVSAPQPSLALTQHSQQREPAALAAGH